MKREFSPGSLRILQREYPALDKETANDILTQSKIHREAAEVPELLERRFYYMEPVVYKMEILDIILYSMEADGINLEKFIDIYPDGDGLVFIQYQQGAE